MKKLLAFFISIISVIALVDSISDDDDYIPYYVNIKWFSHNNTIEHNCIGMFISSQWVITETKCSEFQMAERYRLRFGNELDSSKFETERNVTYFIPHPRYNDTKKNVNLALIRVFERVPFTSMVDLIARPWFNGDDDDEILKPNSTGINLFGLNSENGDILIGREDVAILSDEECDKLQLLPQRFANQICARPIEKPKTPCERLPGSVLIYNYEGYLDVLMGVGASNHCDSDGYFIYTKLDESTRDWIISIAGTEYP